MPTVLAVVGARPNFVKMAPVTEALGAAGVEVRLLHTGQHYDRALSDGFIERLGMPQPDANLGVGSGSHAAQTAKVMEGVEADLREHPADLALVAGDVNSTLAAALAATKLNIAVGHLESGLRSRDWSMPEEVNRVVTDRVSDLLLCTSEDAIENLAAEGIASGVELVGNTMIDSLFRILEGADRAAALETAGVPARGFVLVTLHRPALVDDRERLGAVIEVLGEVSATVPVLFPAHPRTVAHLREVGDRAAGPGADRAADGLRRVHRARGRGAAGDHRLRRGPGGDLGARRPLPHLPRQHRAPGHRRARDEHARRGGSRGAAEGRDRGARGRVPRAPSPDPALGRSGGAAGGCGDRQPST